MASSSSSCTARVDQFAEFLSEESHWYSLGVFLGAHTSELNEISQNYRTEGIMRCLIALYSCLEKKGKPSWESIATALRRMGNIYLADKIHSTHIQPFIRHESQSGSSSSTADHTSTISVEIPRNEDEHGAITGEFQSLEERFVLLKPKVKKAFILSKNVSIQEVQDLLQGLCDAPQLPPEEATFDAVFNRVAEYCSILNFRVLSFLVENLLKGNEALQKEICNLKSAVDRFNSSAKMVELVGLIKHKQTIAGDHKTVKLKVREFWSQFTMKQFETVMNEILGTLYDHLTHITIGKGCICVSWVVPDHIDARKLVPKLSLEFVQIIGVISLHIGGTVIYDIREGCEILEAAMLQAIELKNTRAIELLLAVGCSPEVATYNEEIKELSHENIQDPENKMFSEQQKSKDVDSSLSNTLTEQLKVKDAENILLKKENQTLINEMKNREQEHSSMKFFEQKNKSHQSQRKDTLLLMADYPHSLFARNLVDNRCKQDAAGLAILIGNDYEQRSDYSTLTGPKLDIDRAYNVFSGCFGAACVVVQNESAEHVREVIAYASHSRYPPNYKFIALVFSGHGDEFQLIANDGQPLTIEKDIIDPFQPENAKELAQLPKLIFIDACRGDETTPPIYIPRGGKTVKTICFPPKGNMLLAFSTLPKKQSYECPNQGGLWITKVLARLESDDSSVSDILHNVNKDILDHYQHRREESMQQAELRSTLIGPFKFTRTPVIHQRQLSQQDATQYTKELNELKGAGKIKKREYENLHDNHVRLIVTLSNDRKFRFESTRCSGGSSFKSKNEAMERVAKEALQHIHTMSHDHPPQQSTFARSYSDSVAWKSSPTPKGISALSGIKDIEMVQELKNVLVDKEGFELSESNYIFEEAGKPLEKLFKCEFRHSKFPMIKGEWRKSKKEAKQSVAKKVLKYYYENIIG